ncbi:MAG: hypothetical protein ABIH11_06880 [Candidatus Altiarchaeota archaeon]
MRRPVFTWKTAFLLVIMLNFLTHHYIPARYGGRAMFGDQAAFLETSQNMIITQRIIGKGDLYQNGFGFQLYNTMLSCLLDLNVTFLFDYFIPYQGTLIAIVYFIMSREFLKDEGTALLSTMFLSIQSEIIFMTSWGTHERVTMMLIFMMVTCMKRSFSMVDVKEVRRHIALTYWFAINMMCMNVFFSISTIIAIGISMVIGIIFSRYRIVNTSYVRLVFVMGICLVIAFYMMFFVYTPAKTYLMGVKSTFNQVELIFGGLEQEDSFTKKFPQYRYVEKAYINPNLFLMLRSYDFIILPIGFMSVVGIIKGMLKRRHVPGKEDIALLVFIYLGFFLQFLFTIFFDRVGMYSSNVELRIFPYVHIFTAPLAAKLIVERIRDFRVSRRVTAVALLTSFIVISVFLNLLKSSHEPSVNMHWVHANEADFINARWLCETPHSRPVFHGGVITSIIFGRIGFECEEEAKFGDTTHKGSNPGVYVDSDRDKLGGFFGGVDRIRKDEDIYRLSKSDRVYDNGESSTYWLG